MQIPPRQPTGFPTLLADVSSSDLIHPLYVLPVKAAATGTTTLGHVYQPLTSQPPCDVHVVNLRVMQASLPATNKPRSALILHRSAVDCSYPLLRSVAACPAAGAKVIHDLSCHIMSLYHI